MIYQSQNTDNIINRHIAQYNRSYVRDLTDAERSTQIRINNNARTLELKMYADIARFKSIEGATR